MFRTIRTLFCVFPVLFFLFGCSNPDPVQPDRTSQAETEPSPSDDVSDDDAPSDAAEAASETPDPTATAVPPTLADADLASVTDLGVGVQVQDEQGNLIAIYGFAEWPQPFADLSNETQAEFPFFGDVEALVDPVTELMVLDVGICSAGIDASAFGTAEFFVHGAPDEVLSEDPVLDRGVLASHPVVQPGFDFPSAAECARGWLPVLWSSPEPPATARYVLTTRASASADIERHVYQWDIGGEVLNAPAEVADDVDLSDELFSPGQTVTFNQGPLAETTVVVDGWSELVGAESGVDGTRLVAVSLTFCPSSVRLPEFGLAVDGWNLLAPRTGSDLLGARAAGDPSQNCFDGWLEFEVPYGGVPTGFFASDGASATLGYAEWTLDGAALAPPET